MTVVWAVNGLCTGWVEYGETAALGLKCLPAPDGLMPLDSQLFVVRISGLKPGRQYYYRVHSCAVDFKSAYNIQRGQEISSEVHHFTTPNPAAGETSFSVINDTHETEATVRGLGGLMRARPTEALFWNGDMFNDIRSAAHIVKQVLAPAGQAWAANTPLLPVRGNHDVRGVAARILDRFFDLPSGQWFYTLRHGPVAFLVLDTGEDKPDAHPVYAGLGDFASYRTRQQAWLRTAIKQREFRSAAFRVALLHIPLVLERYLDGRWCSDGKAKWHDLLVKAGVDVIISGHIHSHSWNPPGRGAPYGQLIGGGPRPDQAMLIQGRANRRELQLTLCDLQGREVGNYALKARS
jgi:predicted phosphodiesterase